MKHFGNTMKNVQKLVLIPIERWEKIGDKIPVKEVTMKSVPQKNISHQKKSCFSDREYESDRSTGNEKNPGSQGNSDFSFSHSKEGRKKHLNCLNY